MLSIGNDIVDLSLIDAHKSNQARFYSKILASEEVALYKKLSFALAFEHYLWLCWTVKESTYKFSKRLHPHLLFSPARTVIENLTAEISGTSVTYAGACSNVLSTVKFSAIQTVNYLHAVATSPALINQTTIKIFEVDNAAASVSTHVELLNTAANLLPDKTLKIEKAANNVPTLLAGHDAYPISISHHGKFGSFAILNLPKS